MRKIETWLKEIGRPGAPPIHDWDQPIGWVRSRYNTYILAFKVSTAVANTTAAFNAIPRIGEAAFFSGMLHYLAHPVDNTAFIYDKDIRMKNREQSIDATFKELMESRATLTGAVKPM